MALYIIPIRKETMLCIVLVMEKESKPVVFTHCVFCGTMPAPDQWSTQIENACFDCA